MKATKSPTTRKRSNGATKIKELNSKVTALTLQNEKLSTSLKSSTADTRVVINGMQNLINNTVPKKILARESWLDKANLWLEGKSTLVKLVVGIITLLFPALAGVGVTEMIADSTTTGLGTGGVLGAILTGTLFGRNAKRFNPAKDASITLDGNVYLKGEEIPTPATPPVPQEGAVANG